MNKILKKALISEKSFSVAGESKYTFIVDRLARKEEISSTCENLFGVNVLSINTMNYKGKVKMSKTGRGKRSDVKKAIITVKKGQKIDLFEHESDKKETKEDKKDKKSKSDKVVTPASDATNSETTVKVREKKK
ncbi:MAG: 50S ribosomal protein L23 [bacterium]